MHPLFAIPIFILVMFCVFQITFGTFGSMLSDMLDTLFNVQFANMLENQPKSVHFSKDFYLTE